MDAPHAQAADRRPAARGGAWGEARKVDGQGTGRLHGLAAAEPRRGRPGRGGRGSAATERGAGDWRRLKGLKRGWLVAGPAGAAVPARPLLHGGRRQRRVPEGDNTYCIGRSWRQTIPAAYAEQAGGSSLYPDCTADHSTAPFAWSQGLK